MDVVSLLGARLLPFMVLLRSIINNVHVYRLRLLQLWRNGAEMVGHLVAGNGNILAFDAEKKEKRREMVH